MKWALIAVLLWFLVIPAAFAASQPGKCTGKWTRCGYAFKDDTKYAYARPSLKKNVTTVWANFNISLPANHSVVNASLRVDLFTNRPGYLLSLRVSNTKGVTYGPSHTIIPSVKQATYYIDITEDAKWNVTNSSSLTVEATCTRTNKKQSGRCYLDWIAANFMTEMLNSSPAVNNTLDTLVNASISLDPQNGTAPLEVSAHAIIFSGDGPFTFLWDFNDSTTSALQNTSHVFNSSGNYTVRLTVNDSDGDLATMNATVVAALNVSASNSSPGNDTNLSDSNDTEPSVTILASLTSGQPPLTVSFQAQISGGEGPFTFYWSFGDGGISEQQNTTHTFYGQGAFNVTAQVTDADNDTAFNATVINSVPEDCKRRHPSLSIIPEEQQGAAGGTLVYDIKIMNNDNVSCGISSFLLKSFPRKSWLHTFHNTTLDILPGAFLMTNLSVTSAANETAGIYPFSVEVYNSGANYFAQKGGRFVIV